MVSYSFEAPSIFLMGRIVAYIQHIKMLKKDILSSHDSSMTLDSSTPSTPLLYHDLHPLPTAVIVLPSPKHKLRLHFGILAGPGLIATSVD